MAPSATAVVSLQTPEISQQEKASPSTESFQPEHTSRPYNSYTIDQHLSTLRSITNDDHSDEAGINALPRRRNKSQRPLAIQISHAFWPDLSELSAIIRYEDLTIPAKAIVRQKENGRKLALLQPTNNLGGKLLRIQGPWAGQDVEPLDIKGPRAIPMPVTIGTSDEFKPVFSFLSKNKPIKEGDELGSHGEEFLWKNPILEFERGIVYEDGRLDLCKMVVGPTHIGKLMDVLEPNQHVRHFLLGNNAISTTGAKRIADFISKYPNRMETWYLAGCHITSHGLSLLATEIVKSTSITNLWFKRNPFGPNSASLLAAIVLQTANLRTLDLETTELGDEGVSQFITAISGKPSSLRHLYLNANGAGQEACKSLSAYLGDPNCQLESLFLSTNPIGDAGIELLAPGLSLNKSLVRLTLASAGLTSSGISILATSILSGNSPLQTLDLGASQTTVAHNQKFNYIDDSCIPALSKMVQLPTLRWLNLGRSVFTPQGLQTVREAATSSSLVCINVHRVQIPTISTPLTESASASTSTSTSLAVASPSENPPPQALLTALSTNQKKFYPHIASYDAFLSSAEIRFLRNTSDVRFIDSMYRTRNKRMDEPNVQVWEEGDPVWALVEGDAIDALARSIGGV